jgi:hypothetical protein
MPAPDRMLATLRRATEFATRTPGRTGHFVQLEDCDEVLVAGDLHGHVPNFQVILKAADLANHPKRHLVLQEVVHSSFKYPNGGDKSHQLLDLFAALKSQYPTRVHLLPGNHELAQMTGRIIGKGNESQNEGFVLGVRAAYGDAGTEVYAAYLALIRALPLALRTPNAVFLSHTLIPGRNLPTFSLTQLMQETYTDADYLPGGVVYGITWGRDTSQETADEFLRKVDSDLLVSGHIPTDTGYEVPNTKQLIVDCSASPAAYVLFPADRTITHAELVAGVVVF